MKTMLAIMMFCSSLAVNAQDSTDVQFSIPSSLRDYHYVKRSDPWLTTANAAGLTRFATASIAEAERSCMKEKGGFVDYYGSPDDVQLDVAVESLHRLNSRTVLFGAISYNNFAGKDMAGSAFIAPTLSMHLPFDIVEDSLTNLGDKHRDVYRLQGGVGVDVWRGLALGARFDYTAANYAKYKDLRHKNKLMDMALTLGVTVPLGAWGDAGAHYLYHRNTESVTFSTYGKGDKTYQSLVSYAAFMGQREQFGAAGYTDKSREMPLVSDVDGIGVEFSLHSPLSSLPSPHSSLPSPHSSLLFYNSFTYARRRGYYGRKSPYTITYSEHESHIYDYRARLSYTPRASRHASRVSRFTLDLTLSAENLQNDATTYRELQNDAGATYYNYYTPVKAANRLWVDGSAALTADLGVSGELPAWTLQAGLSWLHRRQTAYLYPYYRRQTIDSRELFAAVTRNRPVARGVWTFALNGAFGWGGGAPCEDLTFATPSEKMDAPAVMDAYLYREHQFLTSAQYGVGGSVKYAFLFPGTQLWTHARLSLAHRKANETNDYSIGCDRTQVGVAVGCTF